jgi:hypothetical protein
VDVGVGVGAHQIEETDATATDHVAATFGSTAVVSMGVALNRR